MTNVVQIEAHADGVVIIGTRLQGAEELFTSLVEQTNKMGLEINENKNTKCMTVSCKPYSEL